MKQKTKSVSPTLPGHDINDDGSSAPVLERALNNAKSATDADDDLIGILEKHILKVDAKDNGVQRAASEIEKLAVDRAAKPT